jgi:HAD superfamily hydrolase (TIGR01509 family)
MISTVIFDLDGLLTDTERLHSQAWRQTLAEVGVVVTEQEYDDHWIRAGLGIVDYVRLHALPYPPDALRTRKLRTYMGLLETSLRPMPGAHDALRALHRRKQLALATSSYGDAARFILNRTRMAHFFDLVATYESVPRLKPHPDVFFYVAEQLNVNPSECVVLEDAEKGVLAAHAAGMKVIAVPNHHTRHNDFSKATRLVRSLREVTLELIDSI